MTECALEIDLPSWLPPTLPSETETGPMISSATVNRLFPITTNDGAAQTYGYVNGVGYFLFERIQLFQDQILLQEWSGDYLYAKQLTEGSANSSDLDLTLGGATGSSVRALAMRATPGHLRIILPLPGMQCPGDAGLPLCAMAWQSLRIKGTLRKLEDLIVCSDATVFRPSPWNIPSFVAQYDDGTSYPFHPLGRLAIGDPTILLSTTQHYVTPAIQSELRNTAIEIPFRRTFENQFTFGELDFISLDKGGVAAVTRRLDGRHPTERLLWFFRNWNRYDNNRLDDFLNDYFTDHTPTAVQPYSNGFFYYNLKLNIAGKEREDLLPPLVWTQLNAYAKEQRDGGISAKIGTMNWGTGDRYGTVYPAPRQPEGSVNLTTADRPTLYLELANIHPAPYLGQRKAEMRVITEGWCVYQVKEGRGKLMFAS